MTRAFPLSSSDTITRQALLGVELIDPISLTLVSSTISIHAVGLDRDPMRTASGRFYWIADGSWPERLVMDPRGLPYEAEDQPVKSQAEIAQDDGLMRIVLRPTTAYRFSDGITVVRGRLREASPPDSAPVAGAQLWLSYLARSGNSDQWADEPYRGSTTANGDFVVFTRGRAKPANDGTPPLVRINAARGDGLRSIELPLTGGIGSTTDLGREGLAWSQMS